MSGQVVTGTPNSSERTPFPNTIIVTFMIEFLMQVGYFCNCTFGMRKITPTSSTPTQRLPGTVSSFGFKYMISTQPWSELAG